jgi:subtilisin family serine protease
MVEGKELQMQRLRLMAVFLFVLGVMILPQTPATAHYPVSSLKQTTRLWGRPEQQAHPLAGCATTMDQNERCHKPVYGERHPAAAPGQVIVKLKANRPGPAFLKAHGLKAQPNADGTFTVTGAAGAEFTTARELGALEEVEWAEPNYRYSVEQDQPAPAAANDPLLDQQWAVEHAQFSAAWAAGINATSAITVAVIDTGCGGTAAAHPDLQVDGGFNTINDSSTITDDNGHGTHVAGIIAASGNNGIGIAGISWAGSTLLCVKAMGSNGSGSADDIAQAIDWATAKHARIINASFGGPPSQAIADAVSRFQSSGGLFIAARGNDSSNQQLYPALLPGVIAVGATDHSDRLAAFSSWGNTTLVAPGVNILSTMILNGVFPDYAAWSGTSMAAPHVVGLAALVWQQNQSWDAGQVAQRLEESSDDLGKPGYDHLYGHGRINAARALGLGQIKPVITLSDVWPQWLPSAGGLVTVTAHIRSSTPLTSVAVSANGTLYPAHGSGEIYTATLNLPSNTGTSDITYSLKLAADNGQLRLIEQPEVIVFARAHEGSLHYAGGPETLNQQMNDIAFAFDADGLPMLAGVDYFFGTVVLQRQLEQGLWGPQEYRSTSVSDGARNGASSVAFGDVNGDDRLDLIGFNAFNGAFIWLGEAGQSGSQFASEPILLTQVKADDGMVADLNQDGRADLVWIRYGYTAWMLANAQGFDPLQLTMNTGSTSANEVEVVKGQAGLELVVAESYYKKFFAHRGPGFAEEYATSGCGVDLAVGDLNRDQRYDVVIPCIGRNEFRYLIQQPDGTFQSHSIVGSGENENWFYGNIIEGNRQPLITISEVETHQLLIYPVRNGAPSLKPISLDVDVLPGMHTTVDSNSDCLQDEALGLAGYIIPYGSRFRLVQQVPARYPARCRRLEEPAPSAPDRVLHLPMIAR